MSPCSPFSPLPPPPECFFLLFFARRWTLVGHMKLLLSSLHTFPTTPNTHGSPHEHCVCTLFPGAVCPFPHRPSVHGVSGSPGGLHTALLGPSHELSRIGISPTTKKCRKNVNVSLFNEVCAAHLAALAGSALEATQSDKAQPHKGRERPKRRNARNSGNVQAQGNEGE